MIQSRSVCEWDFACLDLNRANIWTLTCNIAGSTQVIFGIVVRVNAPFIPLARVNFAVVRLNICALQTGHTVNANANAQLPNKAFA